MDSSLIGKVEKAKKYAQQRDARVRFHNFTIRFRGDHRSHELSFRAGAWHCTCDYFELHATCSHRMAMERILEGMLPVAVATQ
ncbi:MAG: hypothetical protein HY261_08510 [Chloroflexi bacterium]|nr:hypothetical protein [Chloroflexota bacterium]